MLPRFLPVLALAITAAAQSSYFKISVVDEDTGRGVPLVELRTTNEVSYFTDSNGLIAYYEPGLMNQDVWFSVQSHGYEYPADGLGSRGKKLHTSPGGSAVLKIKRLNVAERMYRVTGQGIYRDSLLLGERVPIEQPALNAQVMGQDGAQTVVYRGKIYWFFGDTSKVAYPLGNFFVSGAISDLPGRGGLDPAAGVNLHYFVDDTGFSRGMCPAVSSGLMWLFWAGLITDAEGQERLAGECRNMKGLDGELGRSLVLFNNDSERFETIRPLPLDAKLRLQGRPLRVRSGGRTYQYFPLESSPAARVEADLAHLNDPAGYEGFTCLAPGSGVDKDDAQLERGPDGRLVCGWKRNTPALIYTQEQALITAGKMKAGEGLIQLRDFMSANAVAPFGSTVEWNEFRQRWIMLVQGKPGEIWCSEGDTPLGPWVYATRVVMHDRYAFYLPVQHPFFAQDHDRLIYFEATYTDFFSNTPARTPRYDYNQIMYRLAMDDPRLFLPAPVYRLTGGRYAMREGIAGSSGWRNVQEVAFFGLPPGRQREAVVPIFAEAGARGTVLTRNPPAGGKAEPLFYALPDKAEETAASVVGDWDCKVREASGAEYPFRLELRRKNGAITGRMEQDDISTGILTNDRLEFQVRLDDEVYRIAGRLKDGKLVGEWSETKSGAKGTWEGTADRSALVWQQSPDLRPLYEYRASDGSRIYSTDADLGGMERSREPLCRVWRNPSSILALDGDAQPVRPVQ